MNGALSSLISAFFPAKLAFGELGYSDKTCILNHIYDSPPSYLFPYNYFSQQDSIFFKLAHLCLLKITHFQRKGCGVIIFVDGKCYYRYDHVNKV